MTVHSNVLAVKHFAVLVGQIGKCGMHNHLHRTASLHRRSLKKKDNSQINKLNKKLGLFIRIIANKKFANNKHKSVKVSEKRVYLLCLLKFLIRRIHITCS